jgi:hypothetical protein
VYLRVFSPTSRVYMDSHAFISPVLGNSGKTRGSNSIPNLLLKDIYKIKMIP